MIDIKGRGLMHTYLVAGIHRSQLNSDLASIRLPDSMRFSQLLQANVLVENKRYGRYQSVGAREVLTQDLDQLLEKELAEVSPEDALNGIDDV